MSELKLGKEAKSILLEGSQMLYDAVSVTLGAKGQNVVIKKGFDSSPLITKDGVTVARYVTSNNIMRQGAIDIMLRAAEDTNATAGDGCQKYDSNIYTPYGFIKMGDAEVGMKICGTNGSIQEIEGVFEKGDKEDFKVTFSGGRTVYCSADHWWTVTRNKSKKTMMLQDIMKDYKKASSKYYVENTETQFYEKTLKLDPYLLGVLLGDGSLSGLNADIEISIGKNKEHIIDKLILPEGLFLKSSFVAKKNYWRIKIKGVTKEGKTIKDYLLELGLLGTNSYTKFIPFEYIYSSIDQRKQLLQGFIDTDGHINARGLFEFSSINDNLTQNFITICNSLGISTSLRVKYRVGKGGCSDTPVNVVWQRKGFKYGEQIINIESTGKVVPMRCIKVSNDDNLYITDGYIATHNTTSSIVLAHNMLALGLKKLDEKSLFGKYPNSIEFKHGIDIALDSVIKELHKLKKGKDSFDPYDVAKISANGDIDIAKIINEAFRLVGEDGIISIEQSQSTESSVTKEDGMQIESGLLSDLMINDIKKGTTTYKGVRVLIIDGEIEKPEYVHPYLMYSASNNIPLLVIAHDFTQPIINMFSAAKAKNNVSCLLMKAPFYGENRSAILTDIAAMTGADMITERKGTLKLLGIKGKSLEEMVKSTEKYLGVLNKVHMSKKKSSLHFEVNKDYINNLKELYESSKDEFIKNRIAMLTDGVATINVGGYTDTEVKERLDRVEDAVNATRAALLNGVVAGGGTALLEARKVIKKLNFNSEAEKKGADLLYEVLSKPAEKILANAEMPLLNYGEYPNWIDIRTLQKCNFFDAGIIDPVNVTVTALTNAVSVASTLLTAGAYVLDIK